MTKLIVETDNEWTKKTITDAIRTEIAILHSAMDHIQKKLKDFEARYGIHDKNARYDQVDDMELVEWEGEQETLERLKTKLQRLEEISIEYR